MHMERGGGGIFGMIAQCRTGKTVLPDIFITNLTFGCSDRLVRVVAHG